MCIRDRRRGPDSLTRPARSSDWRRVGNSVLFPALRVEAGRWLSILCRRRVVATQPKPPGGILRCPRIA
eukprot:7214133-Lingulodinium_polyedra.AAC.1